jgi:hypothetical protein
MEIHVPFNEMNKISPLFENYAKNLVAGKIKLKDEEDVMFISNLLGRDLRIYLASFSSEIFSPRASKELAMSSMFM